MSAGLVVLLIFLGAEVSAQYSQCDGDTATIGDGWCQDYNNKVECGYDGGDCCYCSCLEHSVHASCGIAAYDCRDPVYVGAEVIDCVGELTVDVPCPTDIPTQWAVNDSISATSLANSLRCSGGTFDVEWNGHVVVSRGIEVANGIVLNVTGVGSSAAMQAASGTRLFTVVNASLGIRNVKIFGGSATFGGAIAAVGSQLSLEHTSFVGNSATVGGGALYATSSSISSSGRIMFDGNYGGSGGALLFSSVSSFSLLGYSSFINNIADEDGSAMLVINSDVSWEGDASFVNNTSSWGGALVFRDSEVLLAGDAIFVNNTSSYGGGLYAWNSSVSLTGNTSFIRNTADLQGGALFCFKSRVSWAGDAAFLNNTSSYGGGLHVSHSNLSWTGDASFIRNTAELSGGALVFDESNIAWAGDALLENNAAANEGGALLVTFSNVSWEASAVFVNNTAGWDGGALHVSRGSDASWRAPAYFLDNIAAGDGGALCVKDEARAFLGADSLFLRNVALADGGAIYVFNADNGRIQSSSVKINKNTTFHENRSGGQGGALAVVARGLVMFATENVIFSQNEASWRGGGVSLAGVVTVSQFTGLTFLSNTASTGGAAYVSALSSESPLVSTSFNQSTFVGNSALSTGGAIFASWGVTMITDTYFLRNDASAGGALGLHGTVLLDNCTFTENASDSGEGSAVYNLGFLTMRNCFFADNIFLCKPGEFLDFQLSGYASGIFRDVCRGCFAECDDCVITRRRPRCTMEPEHTRSRGGNTTVEMLIIDPGYWRSTKTSTKVMRCFNPEACFGGITGAPNYCKSGHEGPYCSTCSKGYMPRTGLTCHPCSENVTYMAVRIALATSAIVAVVLFSYLGCGRSARAGRWLLALLRRRLLTLKIIVIVWQILTQFAFLANLVYPGFYQELLDGVDIFNLDLSWILSVECIFDLNIHHRLIISTVGPPAALIALGAMHVTRFRNNASHDYLRVVLLSTFLVYSSVSSTLFQMFACTELDNGKSYLRADFRIDCNSSTHRSLMAYAGWMVIIYTVGIPAFYGILLFKNRHVLIDKTARMEDAVATSISNLWELYEPRCFYYELIECARRVLLAAVAVFIYPNTAAQLGVALLISAFFMLLSDMLAPYASARDMWTNRTGHVIVFGSILLALLQKVDVVKERDRIIDIVEGILLIANSCLLLLFMLFDVALSVDQWIKKRGWT